MISPLSKLGLGSAQFGLDQTTLVRGRAPKAEARDILDIAARAQLPVLDVDGHSAVAEAALGESLPRPTPFRISISTVRPDRGPDYVEAEARATLRRLGVEQADAILVPCAADLFCPHGMALWNRLKAMKDAGLTRKIGVAVFASDDPLGVARRFRPDVMQAPASLLDQRLLLDGTLAALTGLGIEVHLRSIFLNGVLFLPPDRAPSHLKAAAGRISRARRLIAESGGTRYFHGCSNAIVTGTPAANVEAMFSVR